MSEEIKSNIKSIVDNSENIKSIVDNIEQNSNIPQEVKNYSEEILKLAKEKEIETIKLNTKAKLQLELLFQDINQIDPEIGINRIKDSLTGDSDQLSQETNTTSGEQSNENNDTKPNNQGSQETNTTSGEDNEARKIADNVEKERGKGGWTDLYVIAKMISLGYIPKLHNLEYYKDFKGQKIKWVYNNAKYISIGGPFTNGTLNNKKFLNRQKQANDFILKQIISEEVQVRALLNGIENNDISNMDRANLNERLANLERLKTALNSGDSRSIKTAFNEYIRISGETPRELRRKISDKIKSAKIRQKHLVENGHQQNIDKTKIRTAGRDAVQEKINKINREIREIENKINDLKQDVTRKLTELDNTAKNHPEKIPELKQEAERLVADYNREIAKLEALGIKNIKGLNAEELKGIVSQSKLLAQIAKVNGGLDKISSGITGKVFGVGAIILIGGGVKNALDKDGLSKETAMNFADIRIGMIPVLGGIYDIGMATKGTDLNGKIMSNEERLTRLGFGVIGLVPALGTVVKGAAVSGKMSRIVKTTEGINKVTKTSDVIIEGGHLTGKIASLGYLGYTSVNTVTYLLPSNSK